MSDTGLPEDPGTPQSPEDAPASAPDPKPAEGAPTATPAMETTPAAAPATETTPDAAPTPGPPSPSGEWSLPEMPMQGDDGPRQKPIVRFVVLGLFGVLVANCVLSYGAAYAINSLYESLGDLMPPLALLGWLPAVLLFAASATAFLVGRRRGDNRMRSLGLGGMLAYAAVALIGLLVFGSCMLIVTGM